MKIRIETKDGLKVEDVIEEFPHFNKEVVAWVINEGDETINTFIPMSNVKIVQVVV